MLGEDDDFVPEVNGTRLALLRDGRKATAVAHSQESWLPGAQWPRKHWGSTVHLGPSTQALLTSERSDGHEKV